MVIKTSHFERERNKTVLQAEAHIPQRMTPSYTEGLLTGLSKVAPALLMFLTTWGASAGEKAHKQMSTENVRSKIHL